MTFYYLASAVNILTNFLILLIFVSVLLTWFMPPEHPVRAALDRIVNPMLNPIRRVVPLIGMLDISPLILMILIELISRVLISLLLSL